MVHTFPLFIYSNIQMFRTSRNSHMHRQTWAAHINDTGWLCAIASTFACCETCYKRKTPMFPLCNLVSFTLQMLSRYSFEKHRKTVERHFIKNIFMNCHLFLTRMACIKNHGSIHLKWIWCGKFTVCYMAPLLALSVWYRRVRDDLCLLT